MTYCYRCGEPSEHRLCEPCAEDERAHHKSAYGPEWRANVRAAIAEQPYCSECGTRGDPDNGLTGDHIQPASLGGSWDRSNIRVLCQRCNSRAGAHLAG